MPIFLGNPSFEETFEDAKNHSNYLSPEEEAKIIARKAKLQKMKETMKILNIPVEDFVCVPLEKLYDILMDETKMKEIMTKLNNRALW
jgi:hypothetical protein